METLQVTLSLLMVVAFATAVALCAVGLRMEKEIMRSANDTLSKANDARNAAQEAAQKLHEAHNNIVASQHDIHRRLEDLKTQADLSKRTAR